MSPEIFIRTINSKPEDRVEFEPQRNQHEGFLQEPDENGDIMLTALKPGVNGKMTIRTPVIFRAPIKDGPREGVSYEYVKGNCGKMVSITLHESETSDGVTIKNVDIRLL